MIGPRRVGAGLLVDSRRPVRFRFDGREVEGLAGDTVASALLANGIRLVGRSFKYHRPRGVVTAGPEEPCALVDVIGAASEPNRPATTLDIRAGLDVRSQNRWPSLRFDLQSSTRLISRFLPAGFYYKTFMRPGWAWERLFEPAIRRAAGLGRLRAEAGDPPAPAETVHDHADVLIVGAGVAGIAAALRLGSAGARVMLVEQDVTPGAGALLDPRWQSWRDAACSALARLTRVRFLARTCVVGAYGHGVFAALETLSHDERRRFGGLAQRLRVIRAQRVLFATGASERLIACPGNDTPGVMLAGAALAYLRRYGVVAGSRPALFVNSDEAYAPAFELAAAGIGAVAIVDVRAESLAADRARAAGLPVHAGAVIERIEGGRGVRRIHIAKRGGSARDTVDADCVLLSGGHSPAASLPLQLGAEPEWHAPLAAFVPRLEASIGRVAGAARGTSGLASAARDGAATAAGIAADLGIELPASAAMPELPADAEATPLEAFWEVRGRGKSFVDLQNDVTADDVRLAQREGYEHAEHMKRYTTHGMATDQGRIGGLVGSAVLAAARGVDVAEVGMTRPRPYVQPVPFAALAGVEVGAHFKPKRRLPLDEWHAAAGATFVNAGLWLRPLVYSPHSGWEPVLEEARRVRRAVGLTDVSSLGKIDVQGRDAARFLDFIYANRFSTLAVGRARYGIMLREDGMLLDDGTTSRLGPEHFLVTTTSANSVAVLEHLEFQLQANCADFDVRLTDVTDQWAQFAIAGPHSRPVLAAGVRGIDLSNGAFPFMAAGTGSIAGRTARIFRISFSGELAYELAVPAVYARDAWEALLTAGRPFGMAPYGLDALNTLRIEKGHVTAAELNGNTGAFDLGYVRLLKAEGDFVGRTLSMRPALRCEDRLQLVGVRPVDRTRRLRNGAHFVTAAARGASLGYITSSTPSTELEGWVGLGLLARGRERIGTRLVATSPIHGDDVEIEIVGPHFLDPENQRVRA